MLITTIKSAMEMEINPISPPYRLALMIFDPIQLPNEIQSDTVITAARVSIAMKTWGFSPSAPDVVKITMRSPGRKRPMKHTRGPFQRICDSAHLTRDSVRTVRRRGKRNTCLPKYRPSKYSVESLARSPAQLEKTA